MEMCILSAYKMNNNNIPENNYIPIYVLPYYDKVPIIQNLDMQSILQGFEEEYEI